MQLSMSTFTKDYYCSCSPCIQAIYALILHEISRFCLYGAQKSERVRNTQAFMTCRTWHAMFSPRNNQEDVATGDNFDSASTNHCHIVMFMIFTGLYHKSVLNSWKLSKTNIQ